MSPDFIHVDVNRAFETLTGLHEVAGKKASEVIPVLREANPAFFAIYGRVVETGTPRLRDVRYVHNKWIAATDTAPKRNTLSPFSMISPSAREGGRRVEEECRLSLRFLETVQGHTEIAPLLEELVSVIKDYTGAEAVGIRVLDSRGNFPTRPIRTSAGRLRAGKPPVDSFRPVHVHQRHQGYRRSCAALLFRRRLLLYNGTSRFLATVDEADKGATCNACNQAGYQSVALIPFRRGQDILGLIHVADHREDMVPLHTVKILEKAGMELARPSAP